ncbi:hypothetical protein CTAM01_09641 [Colletotrichum tamarilloi]|uniref:Uncharacterized protein n=1 Tax=Colletotrichum tamarilloi TaxID=1209934 RepID=A0ABQ9R2S0_9PEZI|nr:uncharacterized protein CTAM01_09641 [Colletotrichum tamarilloi]KAK1493014.1 hypothetical protein CTAM01_09641 [Colletotrichum tamarilloi]
MALRPSSRSSRLHHPCASMPSSVLRPPRSYSHQVSEQQQQQQPVDSQDARWAVGQPAVQHQTTEQTPATLVSHPLDRFFPILLNAQAGRRQTGSTLRA